MAVDFDIRPPKRAPQRTPHIEARPPRKMPIVRPARPTGGVIVKPPQTRARRSRYWQVGLDVAVAGALAAVLALFNQKPALSGAALVAYGLYVLVRRAPGRLTFGLALLAIVGVVVHVALIPDAELVNTYAMYAFFLLLIGTISIALETRDKN